MKTTKFFLVLFFFTLTLKGQSNNDIINFSHSSINTIHEYEGKIENSSFFVSPNSRFAHFTLSIRKNSLISNEIDISKFRIAIDTSLFKKIINSQNHKVDSIYLRLKQIKPIKINFDSIPNQFIDDFIIIDENINAITMLIA